MAITLDNTSSANQTGTSGSWNHTIGNQSGRILLIAFTCYGSHWKTWITNVSFNGQTCHLVGTKANTNQAIYFYAYENPPVGTYAIAWNTAINSSTFSCVGVSYYGLDVDCGFSFISISTADYAKDFYTGFNTDSVNQLCLSAMYGKPITIGDNVTRVKEVSTAPQMSFLSAPGDADGRTSIKASFSSSINTSTIGVVINKQPIILGSSNTLGDKTFAASNIVASGTALQKIWTTGNNYTLYKGASYSKLVSTGSTNAKLVVWDSSGNVIPNGISNTASGIETGYSWIYYKFETPPTLVSGSVYYTGIITDNVGGGIRTTGEYAYGHGGITTHSGTFTNPTNIVPANINYLPDGGTIAYNPTIHLYCSPTVEVPAGTPVVLGTSSVWLGYGSPYCSIVMAEADGKVSKAYAICQFTISDRPATQFIICGMDGKPIINGMSNIRSSDNVVTSAVYTFGYTFPVAPVLVAGTKYIFFMSQLAPGIVNVGTTIGTGGNTDVGLIADPTLTIQPTAYHTTKACLWVEYVPTSEVKTYTTTGILGSNSPSGSGRSLPSPHNIGTTIRPVLDFQVSSVSYYCAANNATYNSGLNLFIGTISGNTFTPILDGYFGIGGDTNRTSHWATLSSPNKPVLLANTDYFIALHGQGPTYYYYIYYVPTTTPNTHGSSGSYVVDEPNRLYSIYITGNYITPSTPPGPALKIEGITPGKLEYTSWSNINTVR